MRIDCHNHSEFSPDANFPVTDMLNSAVEKGIEVFSITDHCEVNEYEAKRHKITVRDSYEYTKKAQKNSPIELLLGIELGQPLSDIDKAKQIISSYDFDMVIGSVHGLKGELDFYYIDYTMLTDEEINNLLLRYYNEILMMTDINCFDTLAHITYPYRYITQSQELLNKRNDGRIIGINPNDYDDIALEIFSRLAKSDRAIELNGSSLLKGQQDIDLNKKYLKMYKDKGGRFITFGSDAHMPQNVAQGIDIAYELLAEVGFDKVTYYKNRKPISVTI